MKEWNYFCLNSGVILRGLSIITLLNATSFLVLAQPYASTYTVESNLDDEKVMARIESTLLEKDDEPDLKLAPNISTSPPKIAVRKNSLHAAEASQAIYQIYELFRCGYFRSSAPQARIWNPAGPQYFKSDGECIDPQEIAPSHGNGFMVNVARTEIDKSFFSATHINGVYKLSHVFCDSIKKHNCGSFLAIYLSTQKGCNVHPAQASNCAPPLIVFKGSSSSLDWKNNVRSRGAAGIYNMMHDLVGTFGARNLIASAKGSFQHVENSVGAVLSNFIFSYYSKTQRDNNKHKFIVTGHSLGGGMAQNFVAMFDKLAAKEDLHFELFTFNTLAKSAMTHNLIKVFRGPSTLLSTIRSVFLETPGTGEIVTSPRVVAINYYSKGDPMEAYNKILGYKNMGVSIRIPSLRRLASNGLLLKVSSLSGWISTLIRAHNMAVTLSEFKQAPQINAHLHAIYRVMYHEKPSVAYDAIDKHAFTRHVREGKALHTASFNKSAWWIYEMIESYSKNHQAFNR